MFSRSLWLPNCSAHTSLNVKTAASRFRVAPLSSWLNAGFACGHPSKKMAKHGSYSLVVVIHFIKLAYWKCRTAAETLGNSRAQNECLEMCWMCPEIGSEKCYSSEAERWCKIGTFLTRQRLTHSRHVMHRKWYGTWEEPSCYVEPRKSAIHVNHVSNVSPVNHESGFLFGLWFCLGTTHSALRQQLSLVRRTVARPTVQSHLLFVHKIERMALWRTGRR